MNQPNNNHYTERESCSESSAIHVMKKETSPIQVKSLLDDRTTLEHPVPEDIQSPKHRRAYAAGFRAAYFKRHLAFVAPAYRWAIARGWEDGQALRDELAQIEAEEMIAEEAAAHAMA